MGLGLGLILVLVLVLILVLVNPSTTSNLPLIFPCVETNDQND
jgi:hypothetical protein